jgi:hypothetical protein
MIHLYIVRAFVNATVYLHLAPQYEKRKNKITHKKKVVMSAVPQDAGHLEGALLLGCNDSCKKLCQGLRGDREG